GPFTWNVTAQTSISHSYSSDLSVYLLPPNQFAFVDALTTGNGFWHQNVFANTLWSDQALYGVTEVAFADNPDHEFLIPEGAMGAMYGHIPNGDWKLVVQDTGISNTGILNDWSLTITTLPFNPPGVSAFPDDNSSHTIPNPGTLTATLNVTGVGPVLDRVTVQA